MSTARKHPPKVRTLGLPDTLERAAMGLTYAAYVKAQRDAVKAHNVWRAVRRAHGYHGLGGYNDAHRQVKTARTRATTAAKRLADAKAAYRRSRTTAEETAA